ncbi:MAG: hypothetical protein QXR64_00535 [Pyrobaculum sp.]
MKPIIIVVFLSVLALGQVFTIDVDYLSIGVAAAFASLTGMVKIPLGPGLVLGLEMSPPILATSALLFIVPNLLGVLAPAYRASRLNIVDALRYE